MGVLKDEIKQVQVNDDVRVEDIMKALSVNNAADFVLQAKRSKLYFTSKEVAMRNFDMIYPPMKKPVDDRPKPKKLASEALMGLKRITANTQFKR